MYWLIVQSEDEANDLLEVAKSCHATNDILTPLKDRSHLLFLFSEADKKLPVSYWDDFLLPVTHTFQHEGKPYLTSITSDSRVFGMEKEKIKSLADYLAN